MNRMKEYKRTFIHGRQERKGCRICQFEITRPTLLNESNPLFTADFHNIHQIFPQATNQGSSGVEEEQGLRLFLDQARGKMATRCLICLLGGLTFLSGDEKLNQMCNEKLQTVHFTALVILKGAIHLITFFF